MTFKELRRTSTYGHDSITKKGALKGRITAVKNAIAENTDPTIINNLKRDLERLESQLEVMHKNPVLDEDYDITAWSEAETNDVYQLLDI